ncbi:MAG: matrixin family metalloprotease [Acidobacteriota bacterium]
MGKGRFFTLPLLGSLLVVACSEALATTAIIPRDEEMVVESRAIVTGKVTGLSTGVDANTDLVYTYVQLEVTAVLKGEIAEREIVLKELGGETPEHGTRIYGMPGFERGQEVLLYLDTWPSGALRVHQGFLGKFNITRDWSTGRTYVERQMGDANVVIIAGYGTNRSELDAYTQMVARLMDANRKRMRAFEQRYYSSVPMLAQPAEFDPSRTDSRITPQWVLLSPGSPARWFEPDSNQPVVFYVNPTGAPGFAQLQEDMQAAMDAWSKAGSSIRVTYGGTTGGCGVQLADGVNTISFNNCDNYFAASQSCSGLLAVSGIVRYFPTQTKNVLGVTYGKAVEANMSFNPYALCNFTNRFQLQEVATHEMGHALGLGHSADTTATMAGYVHFDNRAASLMVDDVQGIKSIYPGGSASAQLSIVTSDLPAASVDRGYTVNLESSGGTGGNHWSLIGGQMPPGIQFTMSGVLFGKTGVSGSFNLIVQVQDWSGNTSQGSFTLAVRPPGLAPVIADATYRKKKVFLSGTDFQPDAVVYVDGDALSTTLDGTTLKTQKRKLPVGVHHVYVVNPDGKQSNTSQLVVQ